MTEPLKVCIISKADRGGGGASKVAAVLAESLQSVDGVVAHHWMGAVHDGWPSYGRKLHGGELASLGWRGARFCSRVLGFPDFLTPEYFIHLARREFRYDLYHLHDVSATLSPLAILWLASHYPVVWTLHDCSPFTGGCLYPLDCTRYAKGCGRCPQLAIWPQMSRVDMTRAIRQHRKRLFAQPGLYPVSPSRWLAETCIGSGVTDRSPLVIPYSVDGDLYRPHDREQLRAILGLPADRFILMLSSWSLHDRRKGIADVLPVLRELDSKAFLLLTGGGGTEMRDALRGFDYAATGYIRDEPLLALHYACADAFLFPSRADNLPNAVLESMACGTPVITYRTGGIPEMVTHGEDGWLAEPGDAQGLIAGVSTMIGDIRLCRALGQAARARAVTEFSPAAFLQSHLRLYSALLRDGSGAQRR
ncbi:MAG: hypothetical protein C1943_03290 [Halochromatium sp.]|nr:hypothetical protein [Halochromatium sp.]